MASALAHDQLHTTHSLMAVVASDSESVIL